MHQGNSVNCCGRAPSGRCTDQAADEERFARLLERTYATRAARLDPADDALAKLTVALDALETAPRRQTDHHRLVGTCALVALLLLLLTPFARAEFAASTRHAQRSAVSPMSAAVSRDANTGTTSGKVALPPVTVAARGGGSVAVAEGGTATIHAPAANGMAPMSGMSETPLRDLLARAGIRAPDANGGSSGEGQPPQH